MFVTTYGLVSHSDRCYASTALALEHFAEVETGVDLWSRVLFGHAHDPGLAVRRDFRIVLKPFVCKIVRKVSQGIQDNPLASSTVFRNKRLKTPSSPGTIAIAVTERVKSLLSKHTQREERRGPLWDERS